MSEKSLVSPSERIKRFDWMIARNKGVTAELSETFKLMKLLSTEDPLIHPDNGESRWGAAGAAEEEKENTRTRQCAFTRVHVE